MSDVIEPAKTSRSRCRHCRKDIEEGDLRFGSDIEGLYNDGGAAYSWFHLRCASQRMPDRLLVVLRKKRASARNIEGYDKLVAACDTGVKKSASIYPYGERAPSGRAKCIKCDQAIPKGELRVAVEREIVTGSFTTVGAGYLHPACAVEYLKEPNLGSLVKSNSPLLSPADLSELAKQCDAVAKSGDSNSNSNGAKSVGSATVGRIAQKVVKPQTVGNDLVFADQLIEKGDLRGELIVVESDLAAVGIDDKRGDVLAARAAELRKDAKVRGAWEKEMKAVGVAKTAFTLEGGLPSNVLVKLLAKAPKSVPDHPWITGFRVASGTEVALAALLKHPAFARIRHLVVDGIRFSWDGFRGFCSCDEVRGLESLSINVHLGPRALLMLLGSTRFDRLSRLTVGGAMYAIDPDLRGFDGFAGLPALRSLHLQLGTSDQVIERLLRSPLVQRLEELGTYPYGDAYRFFEHKSFPNLRRLAFAGAFIQPKTVAALAKCELPRLASLDFSEFNLTDGTAMSFANPKILPSLRRLDVSRSSLSKATLDALRARFGDRLIANEMIPKKAKPKPKATAKKKRSSRT